MPKKFIEDKWVILGLKMAYPHNSGLALRIFKKFYRMTGANRLIKIIFAGFYAADSTHGYLVWETQSLIEFLKLNL